MKRRWLVGAVFLSLTGQGVRAKKQRGHCPAFKASEFCAAGEVYAEGDGVCRPRWGTCGGKDWYCKGHHHPHFLCDPVMFPDRPQRCCRAGRDVPYIPHPGGGKGLCHGFKPRLMICEEEVV